ncbi:MAG: TlpA disulfide reductase family protein [Bacteroidota bacterium]
MKNLIILFSLISLLTFSSNSFAKGQKAKTGEVLKKMFTEKSMPNITLSDINGKKVNVAELAKSGKVVVFSFWATWCIPCKKELTEINKVYEDWQKKYNVEVIAISIDDSRATAKVKTYVNGEGWDYQVLLDVNSDLKRAMGIQSVPYTAVVDKTGNIVYEHNSYVEGDELELEKKIAEYSK